MAVDLRPIDQTDNLVERPRPPSRLFKPQLFLTNTTPRHRLLHPLRKTMESGRMELFKPSHTGLMRPFDPVGVP